MAHYIDTTILEDEVICLTHYFISRDLSNGEVITVLQTALDKEHFKTAMIGMKKLIKS